MDRPEFERWCARLRVAPERRYEADIGTVYLGDSRVLCPPNSEYAKPHYRTVWAVVKGELGEDTPEIPVGQTLYFDFGTSKEGRLSRALEEAQAFMVAS